VGTLVVLAPLTTRKTLHDINHLLRGRDNLLTKIAIRISNLVSNRTAPILGVIQRPPKVIKPLTTTLVGDLLVLLATATKRCL
jgi:hypothetical protein